MMDNLRYFEALVLHSFQGSRVRRSADVRDVVEGAPPAHEAAPCQTPKLDDLAMRNGALGGKVIGAGGGGFLLFYTEDKKRLRHALRDAGLEEVRVRFDFEGTKTLVQ